MSPRVDPATTLPRHKHRTSDPLDRIIAESLDHQLLCYAQTDVTFTIPELRDQLLQLSELENVDLINLRLRVRDRLRTLQRHGLVEPVGVRGKNRKLFRMMLDDAPDSPADPIPDSPPPDTPEPYNSSMALISHLEQERHQLCTEMQASVSEAEHYQHLISQFPDAEPDITPLLQAAIERGGTLKGQWDANTRIRHSLIAKADQEVQA